MNRTVIWVVGGAVGLGLIVLLALSIASEPEVDDTIDYGTVTVDGDPLPFLEDTTVTDIALGFTAPSVSGTDWDGNVTSIEPDGRPKIVIFLAHWCQFCQAEVPEVQEWLEAGGLPENVDMYSISVFSDRLRPNWPARGLVGGRGLDGSGDQRRRDRHRGYGLRDAGDTLLRGSRRGQHQPGTVLGSGGDCRPGDDDDHRSGFSRRQLTLQGPDLVQSADMTVLPAETGSQEGFDQVFRQCFSDHP